MLSVQPSRNESRSGAATNGAPDHAVEGSAIHEVIQKNSGASASTNLDNLFKKALDQERK